MNKLEYILNPKLSDTLNIVNVWMREVTCGLVYSNRCNRVDETFSIAQNMNNIYKNRGNIIVNIYISQKIDIVFPS